LRKKHPYIKKSDKVVVLAGKEKGKIGTVLRIEKDMDCAVVEKVNMVKRHTRAGGKNAQGGIVEKEAPIHISNLMLVSLAMGQYTSEHGGLYPPHDRWAARLSPDWIEPDGLVCPSANRAKVGYAFSAYLGGKSRWKVEQPKATFAFWDCVPESQSPAFRHEGRINVGFVDGRADSMTPIEVFEVAASPQPGPAMPTASSRP